MSYVGDDLPSGTPRSIQWNGNTGIAQYGPGDDRLFVVFYKGTKHNAHRSDMEGRPIFDEVDMVRIQQPGEQHTIMERPVNPQDKIRFAVRWQQYQQNAPQTLEGTPVNLLFPGKPSVAEVCKALNIHTVEQLASLSGSGLDALGMGGQEYVNLAKRYIDSAKDGAEFHKMRRELESSQSEVRVLKEQVRVLMGQVNGLIQNKLNPAMAMPMSQQSFDAQTHQINSMDPPKRGPGRPRKSA